MQLQTKRLSFSDISLDYLNDVHQLHSIPRVDEFNTLGLPGSIEITKNIMLEWLEKTQIFPKTSFIFCIHINETRQFIGLIGLNIGKVNYKIAEVWYKTNPDYWNKGYTTEALLEVLKFGFTNLALHRIEAGCAVDNIASIRVLEKAGMILEGRKREMLPIRGKWVDNYFYSILEKEFEHFQQS